MSAYDDYAESCKSESEGERISNHEVTIGPLFLLVVAYIIWITFLYSKTPNTAHVYYESVSFIYPIHEILTEEPPIVTQIKHDLKMDDVTFKIDFSPVYSLANIEMDGRNYKININPSFYSQLNEGERIALIGHEMGHLSNWGNSTDKQILADLFATRYAGVDAVLSLLDNHIYNSILVREDLAIKEDWEARHDSLTTLKPTTR